MDMNFIQNNNIVRPQELVINSTVPVGENMYYSEKLTFEKVVDLAQDTGAQKVSYFEPLTENDTSLYSNPSVSKGRYFVLEYLVTVPGVLNEPVVVKNFLSPFNPFASSMQNAQMVSTDTASSNAWVAVLEIELPYRVPHVFINNLTAENSMSKLGLAGFFRTKFPLGDIAQTVKMEGPFSQWFEAISMKNEDLSVFTVLAPNLMESLMTASLETNIEFVNNRIYVTKMDGKAKSVKGVGNLGVPMSNYTLLLGYGLSNASLLTRASRPAANIAPMKTFTPLLQKQALATVARLLVVVMGLVLSLCVFFLGAVMAAYGLLESLLTTSVTPVLVVGLILSLGPILGAMIPMISHSVKYRKMRAARLAYAQGS